MADGGFVVAQISDTHIGSAAGDEANLTRLDRVLDHLCRMARRPNLLLVTGDLTDGEDEASYRLLHERLERCAIPWHVCIGNHDDRATAARVFGRSESGFFHYAVDVGPLRLIILDSVGAGRHGGAFCETRSAWLRDRLDEAPDRPTLIALHHPPVDNGIGWLTAVPEEPWLAELDAALTGRRQVIALVAGHIHRPISASRNGIAVRICPSVANPITVDLAPLNPDAPDGRPLAVDGPPGYALHLWRGGTLVTHVDFVEELPVLARFDEDMQPLIRKIFAERP